MLKSSVLVDMQISVLTFCTNANYLEVVLSKVEGEFSCFLLQIS